MTNRDSSQLLIGLLLFAGGACAGVIGSAVFAPARDAAPGRARENPNEVSESMARLSAEVRALAERLERAPAASSPTLVREATASGAGVRADDEILVMLRRLTAAQAATSAGSLHNPGPLELPPPMTPQKRSAIKLQLKSLGDSRDAREAELTRSHQFMTFQQILDRYGRPDDMTSAAGSLVWTYVLSKGGDEEGDTQVWFTFVDGIVVEASFNY
jgi:hypothetical protein